MAKANQKRKKCQDRCNGEAHIQASFNTIIISLTNTSGQVTSGHLPEKWALKGLRKHTLCSANSSRDCAKEAHDFGLRRVKVYVKGPGAGRESAIRALHNSGIEVTEIVDVTPTSQWMSST